MLPLRPVAAEGAEVPMSGLFTPDAAPIPLEVQIACVEREIVMRKRAYPRWVANGTMTQGKADREIEQMAAVLKTLQGLLKP